VVIIPIEEFTSVYKVYLKNLLPSNPLMIDLSFFGNPKSNPSIPDFQTFLSQFNELSRKKHCVSLNNIQEISYLGTASKEQFSHCHALLFTIKENNQRRGFFIGFLKEKGYFLHTQRNCHLYLFSNA